MDTLSATNLNLSFADRIILDDVSITLNMGDKIALTGANGEGKTTLLNILGGKKTPDSGKIVLSKGASLSYLEQLNIVDNKATARLECKKAFQTYFEKEKELSELFKKCENSEYDQKLYDKIDELKNFLDDDKFRANDDYIEKITTSLGINKNILDSPLSTYSGGMQMRIALSKCLLENSSFLLLDEPTNFLDLESRIWLGNFLKKLDAGIILVSHDRDFLDNFAQTTWEIFRGKIKAYKGGYTKYEKIRTEEIEDLKRRYNQQEEMIAKNEAFIEKFRYKATKAKQVQSRVRMLEKEEKIELPENLKKVHITFPPPQNSPKTQITIKDLGKKYGDRVIFDKLNFEIFKGDRIAITGQNGQGKSTLIKAILGEIEHTGTVCLANNVKIAYFAQDSARELNENNSVIKEIEEAAPQLSTAEIKNLLGGFLFRGDDVEKYIKVLSGGERERLALLKILLSNANVMILDEATNHLDLNTKDILLEALQKWEGTIIFVSHDALFLKKLANRFIKIENGIATVYNDNWDYYIYKLEQEKNSLAKNDKLTNPKDESKVNTQIKEEQLSYQESNKKRNENKNKTKKAEEILNKIEKLNNQKTEKEGQLAKPEVYSDFTKSTKINKEIEELNNAISKLEEEWLELQ